MRATLSELAKHTAEVVRPIQGGKKVVLTNHGRDFAEILPLPGPVERKAALEALRAIGPVILPPRK